MSWYRCDPLNGVANLDQKEILLEETADTRTFKVGNVATLQAWKDGNGTPEHIAYDVSDRDAWEWLVQAAPAFLDEWRTVCPVYLPAGKPWHCTLTGRIHRGGQRMTVEAPWFVFPYLSDTTSMF